MLPVFKTTFSKSKPKEIIYRNFIKFNEEDFNQERRGRLSTELVDNYSSFENVFMDVLIKHAPMKKKVIRANYSPYTLTKALRKAIMKRSLLEKIYFKKRTQESFKKYKKQKNYCSRLYKRERKSFLKA